MVIAKEDMTVATVRLISDGMASPEVKAVFDDIRETRGTDFVNNFWRALANDPVSLRRVWGRVKEIMGGEGALDPLTREMIYVAVSAANACTYCVHSHTASARAKGMTPEQHAELVAIIGLAAETNFLANAMQVPVDPEFEAADA